MKTLSWIAAALCAAGPALALDGKWTPAQVLELDPAWLAEQGLQLPPSALWDAQRGTGLLSATVNIGGCTGAFVSATGLILTNHHCLFGLVQEHSSPERDLIRDGYLARSKADELPSATLRVTFPRRFTDVTEQIIAALPTDVDALNRLGLIEAKQKELVADCEEQGTARCQVAVFDEGVKYVLIESTELRDVRLVYAPPRAIGEYGGEVDNWMWPRHTGDFAIARVYVGADGKPADNAKGNIAYQPEFHFPIAANGLAADDFVMVLGYPGITYRALIAEEMRERRERFFVRREEVFGQWIKQLEQASAGNAAAEIAVASNVKSLLNRYKNAQGQIAGLDRGKIIERQQMQDDAVALWAKTQPGFDNVSEARTALRALLAEGEVTWERDFLLGLIAMGVEPVPGGIPPMPKSLYFGATLAQQAYELRKPDAARAAGFAEVDQPRLRARLRSEQQSYFPAAEQRIFAALVRRALALPAEQRISAVDARFAQVDDTKLEAEIATMIENSMLLDPDARDKILGENIDQLLAHNDDLLNFGVAWNDDLRQARAVQRERSSRSAIYRPIWRRAVAAHAGKPIAPDANSTLRLSFAHVQGYAPRDGVLYTPFTTLTGAVAKHTGAEPFALPGTVLEAAKAPGARWAQASLGDVPINFLADGDTSGGNSGSPVLNGRGELVGVNFDRVWENVAGDFGFNPALSRNISVDVRYLLWMLDRVDGADALMQELGVAPAP